MYVCMLVDHAYQDFINKALVGKKSRRYYMYLGVNYCIGAFIYSGTPLEGHPLNKDTCIKDTLLCPKYVLLIEIFP